MLGSQYTQSNSAGAESLASPGEYNWTVGVWRRCGLISYYFDHLLLIWLLLRPTIHLCLLTKLVSKITKMIDAKRGFVAVLGLALRNKHHSCVVYQNVELCLSFRITPLTINCAARVIILIRKHHYGFLAIIGWFKVANGVTATNMPKVALY